MSFIRDYFSQKVPAAGGKVPTYYRKALENNQLLLCVCFFINLCLITWTVKSLLWYPAVVLAAAVLCLLKLKKINARTSLRLHTAIICMWCGWYVSAFGWSLGSQHMLLSVLVLVFFNVYEPPWSKILYFLMLIVYRMALFAWSLDHAAQYITERWVSIALQSVNSVTLFLMMGICYIRFSTSIQDSERELLVNNQLLSRKAETDPLTQLPNRLAMLEYMETYLKASPGEQFCVAIADIDLFKKINDTYGHNCGDYTLKMLADLFRAKAGEQYQVCRWGGEEFFFFLPGKNLDEAGVEMNDLRMAVSRMQLNFEGIEFSITITAGIEENDFHSTMDDILEIADRKLYRGKANGRNQVVI